jgi:sulfur-oxidizing protein SoxB
VFPASTIRTIGGVARRDHRQAYPYTPIANPRYFVADWTFGIQEGKPAEGHRRSARQGRAGGRAAVAQRDGHRLEARVARARPRRDPRRSHARRRAGAVARRERGGRTLVTNAGSNGKFLAVLDLDVRGGKVADFRYKLLPVFSNLLAPIPQWPR